MRIYVASSWRNTTQPMVVDRLRREGHEVYDFREPTSGSRGFNWSEIDEMWQSWTPAEFKAALGHSLAVGGYALDVAWLHHCDAVVLVNPCGRSAHLEMGYASGAGKVTIILLADGEPELMYRMADHVCISLDEVVKALGTLPAAESKTISGESR